MLKFLFAFFASGFQSHTGYTLATHLYYYDDKPQIGFVLRKHYVLFWIPGFDKVATFVTQKEANDYVKDHGIILRSTRIEKTDT